MPSLPSLRRCLLVALLPLAGGLSAQNAYLTNLVVPRYIKAGMDYPLTVRARNAGGPAYNFFQVNWNLDGGPVYTMNQPVGGNGIIGNNNTYLEVTHPQPLNASAGQHLLKVWITVQGETDPSNDTIIVAFTALETWASKVVLLETRTETWCPNCPPSNTATNSLMQDPRFAVVKFHLNDGLEFAEGVEYYTPYGTGFTPSGVLELGEYGEYDITAYYPGWAAEMSDRARGVSPVVLSVDHTIDHVGRVLTATVDARFTYSFNGSFVMNVHLAENNVPGPQENAPANYIHHGVMRAMLGGAEGTTGIIPSSPVPGETYSHTYTYTVPEEYDLDQLYLVAFVEHRAGPESKYCLNAYSTLTGPVGMADNVNMEPGITVIPNPFKRSVELEIQEMDGLVQVEVVGMDGRIHHRSTHSLHGSGRTSLDLGDLAKGTYLLRISDGTRVVSRRVVRAD